MAKPRTLKEKEVVKLSKKLGSLGKRDEKRLLKGTYGSCPYEEMYNRAYAIVNVQYHGWQVLRYVRISRRGKRNPTYTSWEVMQVWSKLGEGQVIIARKRCLGMYLDNFMRSSDLELRRPFLNIGSWVDIPYCYIYHKSVGEKAFENIDKVVDGENHIPSLALTRRKMYQLVSESSFPEYFIKDNPYLVSFVEYFRKKNEMGKYVTAFKILARHHYHVEDPEKYITYIDDLAYLGKDLHNPYYVCPCDFASMSETIGRKAHQVKEQRHKEKIAKQQAEENERYQGWRRRFYGMEITDGQVSCKVLRSVFDFYEEGKAMHNCVYECKYYNKPYSLIMSARIGGKRVETVEFDLKERRVVQAYGFGNKFSEHHKEIVELVNAHADMIESYNKNINNLIKQAV